MIMVGIAGTAWRRSLKRPDGVGRREGSYCVPTAPDPDVGLLACRLGETCEYDRASPLGGTCHQRDVTHRKLSCGGGQRYATFYYQRLCNSSSPYFTDAYGQCGGCEAQFQLLTCNEFCEQNYYCSEIETPCFISRRRKGGEMSCIKNEYFEGGASVATNTTFYVPRDWEYARCSISKTVCKDVAALGYERRVCYHYSQYRPYCDDDTATDEIPCGTNLSMNLDRCYVDGMQCTSCANDRRCLEFNCVDTNAQSAGGGSTDDSSGCEEAFILGILTEGIPATKPPSVTPPTNPPSANPTQAPSPTYRPHTKPEEALEQGSSSATPNSCRHSVPALAAIIFWLLGLRC